MSTINYEKKNLAEMVVHTPLCSHQNPKRVLFFGDASNEIQNEFAKHDCATDFVESIERILSLDEKIYDVVIFLEKKPDYILLAHIEKFIKSDGIFVSSSSFYQDNIEVLKSDLNMIGKIFWICMPYNFDSKCFIFASKKYHPTADIVLQRADLLDDLDYYSNEIHLASFVFPALVHRKLTGIAKR